LVEAYYVDVIEDDYEGTARTPTLLPMPTSALRSTSAGSGAGTSGTPMCGTGTGARARAPTRA
jgi:hypothetical protein